MESTNSLGYWKGPGSGYGSVGASPYTCQYLHLHSHISLSSNQINCLYFHSAIRWIECRSLASLGTVLVTVVGHRMDVSNQFGTPEPLSHDSFDSGVVLPQVEQSQV